MSVRQVLVAVDQLANTLIGGWADETLSARAYRMRNRSKVWAFMRKAIDVLFFLDADHCRGAWMDEKVRTQIAPEYGL